MFFSNSTKNGHDPFSSSSFPDQSFFKHQDFHLPISFFHFPSPFELDDDDDLFLQPHNSLTNYNSQNNASASTIAETETPTPTATATMVVNSDQKTPRKRLCKKDRHSKISTARGLRDRRMRLSLPVARQFFGLQDLLGVDKGSKTVEWLLIQARPEILKLAKERNYSLDRAKSVCSSNSEGDIVSGIDEVGIGNEENQKEVQNLNSGKEKMKKKRMRQPRKTMAKELREKARARARARTKEKLQIQIQGSVDNEINYSKNYEWRKNISSSWSSPFETAEEESAGAQSYEKPISCTQFGVASDASAAMIDYQNSFEIIGKWSPSAASTFNYNLQQTGTLLQEQQQQHQQFADSQFFG